MKFNRKQLRKMILNEIKSLQEMDKPRSIYDHEMEQLRYSMAQQDVVKFRDGEVKAQTGYSNSGEPRHFIKVISSTRDPRIEGNVYQCSLNKKQLEDLAQKGDYITSTISFYCSSGPQPQQQAVYNSYILKQRY